MSETPPEVPSRQMAQRRLKTFDDDDIVRHAMCEEVPVVGLVRDRTEYKEMREMALIFGVTRGLTPKADAKKPSPDA